MSENINNEAISNIKVAAERIINKLSGRKLTLREKYQNIEWSENNPLELLFKTKGFINQVVSNLKFEDSPTIKMARKILTGLSEDIKDYVIAYRENLTLCDPLYLKVTNQMVCYCCGKDRSMDEGRLFFWGQWICNYCEDDCDPNDPQCVITGLEREIGGKV